MMLSTLDLAIVVAYVAVVMGFGGWLFGRQSTERYMAAGRSLPGWAVGLSIFGSYVSSISFLANPGSSYSGNWKAFSFALLMPVAAWIAVIWFIPFYRRMGDISAYDHLERRFGRWARIYAVACYLALQITRLGTILFLLAGALQPFTGGTETTLIVVTSILVTIYPFLGGAEAMIWAGVFQSVVLLLGPLACLGILISALPGGASEFFTSSFAAGKFSMAPYSLDLSESTFWVILAYGFVTHLQNFGIDQAYVQRYITARSDQAARRSVWLATAMFIPVSGLFFLIGTALFAHYGAHPEVFGEDLKPDKVFPWFIRHHLPPGFRGIVLAALCAAAMDSNLTSMATLYWCDVHKRLFPQTDERRGIIILRIATVAFAVLGTLAALGLLRSQQILNDWWMLAGISSGGMLGLFLLGRFFPRATGRDAAWGAVCGTAVILWMTISAKTDWLPMATYEMPSMFGAGNVLSLGWRSPFNENLILVVGTITVILAGMVSCRVHRALGLRRQESEPDRE